LPSIPTSIGDEIKTNIFLRSDNEIIAKKLGFKKKDSFEVFKKLRDLKDNF
jgi:hydroxyacylglutathione hydrolase